MRRNLVIVRAGDQSLHPKWLAEADRSWDILVNYYGDDPIRYRAPDVTRIDSKGPKWPALGKLIAEQRDLIARYDYIWLPDDDIDCRGRDIDRLFKFCREHQLWLAQPALSSKSYVSWTVTLRCPLSRLRWTNFVEIMVPCFSREFLLRCLPTMTENLSGWGLDFLWPRLAEPHHGRIAIIDAVAVTHTRPIGSANYELLRERGATAHDEYRALCDAQGITDRTVRVEMLATRGGARLRGASLVSRLLLGSGYAFMIARAYLLRQQNRWDLDRRLRPAITAPVEFTT